MAGAALRVTVLVVLLAMVVDAKNHTNKCLGDSNYSVCNPGMFLPVWQPQENLSSGDRIARGIVYFTVLLYLFLGVSIVSDRFMAAIEVITAQEREIRVQKPNGEVFKVTVRVWNETVSNLTLMALGSSAPEILLSIIEIVGKNFRAGDLGPNTIVGSAAYNLFMIIAISVWVVPSTEIRRQQHLNVFFVTCTWSIWAYVWMYLILSVITPGVIDIWEGLLTFMFFPLTVVTAYVADRKLMPKFAPIKLRPGRAKGVATAYEGGEGDVEMQDGLGPGGYKPVPLEDVDPEVRAFEETRREFMEIFKELRKQHPNTDIETLQELAEEEMINRAHKSRAFYRVQATRRITGGGNIVRKKLDKEHHKEEELHAQQEAAREAHTAKLFFDPAHYTVLENVGKFTVQVSRKGGPPDLTIMVDYRTEDGTANAGADYIGVHGTLTFAPGDEHKHVEIEVIDDEVFEEDEHFMVHLENLRVQTKDGLVIDPLKLGGVPVAIVEPPTTATVMILDDDHAGVFGFEHANYEVVESAGTIHLKIARSSGARGKVLIPFRTIDGTAISPRDFANQDDAIEFDNDEVEKYISIGIVDDEEYEKNEEFYVELGEPIWTKKLSDQSRVIERYLRRQRRKLAAQQDVKKSGFLSRFRKEALEKGSVASSSGEDKEPTDDEKIAELGRPKLGEVTRCTVKIKESKEFKGVVDKMIKTANVSLVLGTSSWREQFIDALTVSAGDDDGGGGDEKGEGAEGAEAVPVVEESEGEKMPSVGEYIMHFISVPWKLLFALIPPTDYLRGWLCFTVSILMIGLLTAVIGDVASHFGCSIGLKDAVTAISFVALGTSVPDTFASKVAAIQDKYADSSIGNVTGSNAVNVFLGIGIAWSIAAIYHAVAGPTGKFEVDPGTLAYSVAIFCAEATVCIAIILLRRLPAVGGELGGPMKYKIPTVVVLVSLWLLYLLLSGLESYCVIEGF